MLGELLTTMSKLEELIERYCPDGVECKTIGETCEVLTGGEAPEDSIKSKKPQPPYIYPIFSNGIGDNALWGFSKQYRVDRKTVTFSSIGTIGYPTVRKEKFTPVIRLKTIYPKDESTLSLQYLKYALEIVDFKNHKSSIPNINANMLKNIEIPVPPLPVQEEIVRILDKFTELEDELEEELRLRKKQYEYYRDKMLSEEYLLQYCTDGVEYKTIKNCANVGTGSSDRKDASDDGLYPFYVPSKKVEHKENDEFDEEAIIIPGEGGIGEIFHYVNGKYALHQRAYRIHFTNKEVDTVFAKYYMESEFKNFITKKAVGATVTSIRKPMIEDFEIPVPPLPVQEEIVRVLDKFSALTTDISEGLPAEIKMRRQQYEYYRDKLLTFKRLEC